MNARFGMPAKFNRRRHSSTGTAVSLNRGGKGSSPPSPRPPLRVHAGRKRAESVGASDGTARSAHQATGARGMVRNGIKTRRRYKNTTAVLACVTLESFVLIVDIERHRDRSPVLFLFFGPSKGRPTPKGAGHLLKHGHEFETRAARSRPQSTTTPPEEGRAG